MSKTGLSQKHAFSHIIIVVNQLQKWSQLFAFLVSSSFSVRLPSCSIKRWYLSWPCDLLWPVECGRNDSGSIPSLGLCCFLASWCLTTGSECSDTDFSERGGRINPTYIHLHRGPLPGLHCDWRDMELRREKQIKFCFFIYWNPVHVKESQLFTGR